VLLDLSQSSLQPSSLLLSQIDIPLLQLPSHAIDFPFSFSRPILMSSFALLVVISTSSVPSMTGKVEDAYFIERLSIVDRFFWSIGGFLS
jgi:hypothetical protein